MRFNAATHAAFGYVVTALLYLAAWVNPRLGTGEKLIGWLTFEKFCLMEFLSCHAITLLAGTALAMEMEGGSKEFARIFWGLIALYFVLGTATYLFHRDHGALFGFYAILVTRGISVLSLQAADEDMLRAVVLKNLLMFVPMMLLIGAISSATASELPGARPLSRAAWALSRSSCRGAFSCSLRPIISCGPW